MPRKKPDVPPFRVHKPTGQGYANIGGRCVYFGRHDAPEAKQRYARAIAEAGANVTTASATDISIVELLAAFWRYAERYYSGNSRGASTRLS